MIRLAKTITIEAVTPLPLDTKITIFQLENGLYQGHVLRKRESTDWALQYPTKECPDEFVAEELARGWHRRNPRYFEENPNVEQLMGGVKL